MTRYLLDSNVFIQSHRFEYRFSFCGGFWALLEDLHYKGMIFSINGVKKELLHGKDELSAWAQSLPDSFFLNERDVQTQPYYADLMNWAVASKQFSDIAKQKFASDHADPWLVAHAAANHMKLVTHEIFDVNIKKSIKIPNAAAELKVDCVNLYNFLEELAEGTFKMKLSLV